ncbi:putative sporulation protein YtxC [Desulfosporosinus sp. PR]|uniref:putative sporulation protein YtxC n=1 Tax=Candidatus Desulfosporosinus nitrosoreducens TaxID=3401928 RepID=UPI0027F46BD2|nr:putative sporulation protein YtxC [Desulfosporosinus sp. PR]MDQ7092090.1 putative sporulation protein YtxC [Desulfosporosinus sp. PR]
MEHSVRLGTQKYHKSICECLRELSKQEQLPVQIIEQQQGKRWLIHCKFLNTSPESENEEVLEKIQRYYLANALAETILLHWEKEHVRYIIKKNNYLLDDNGQTILKKALEYLNKGLAQDRAYRVNRKTKLVAQILSCLDHSLIFDIEGFLSFRAQEYKRDVSKAVEFAIEEYVVEKEYLEFIQLLKHFVDNQTPQLESLHVGMTSKGKFYLFNNEGDDVTHDYLADYQLDNLHELGYEDLLVSALIAVAPRHITLHIRYNGFMDTLQTIRNVFGSRVQDCNGCSLCEDF